MKVVSSNGGPLVALPAELAKAWCGTEAPRGVAVPKGREWSGNDASYPYPGATKSQLPRPAILTAKLKPGTYRVLACDWLPDGSDYELRAIRLEA